MMAKKYNPANFLNNVTKVAEIQNNKDRNKALGVLIGSLQRPATELLQSVVLKQKQDVDELLKCVGWI
jgi:hypothetical protein